MSRTRTLLFALCVSGTVSRLAVAAAPDPFRDADAIHEIGLSRLAADAGDAALASALEPTAPRERALMAIRATPFASAPEHLLPALAQLAAGRDPNLAPEAAAALMAIGARLQPSELAAREVLRQELGAAQRALAEASAVPSLRPDISLAITQLGAELKVLEASAFAP